MRSIVLLDYGDVMTDKTLWAPVARKAAQGRAGTTIRWKKSLLVDAKTIAAIETEVRRLTDEAGVVSINEQLEFAWERFVIGYREKFGELPDPTNKQAIRRYAAEVLKKR